MLFIHLSHTLLQIQFGSGRCCCCYKTKRLYFSSSFSACCILFFFTLKVLSATLASISTFADDCCCPHITRMVLFCYYYFTVIRIISIGQQFSRLPALTNTSFAAKFKSNCRNWKWSLGICGQCKVSTDELVFVHSLIDILLFHTEHNNINSSPSPTWWTIYCFPNSNLQSTCLFLHSCLIDTFVLFFSSKASQLFLIENGHQTFVTNQCIINKRRNTYN